jgi:lysophospholipid acyltransferase (LPLAT)-like uncharacterized protein
MSQRAAGARMRVAVLGFAARLLYGVVQKTLRPVVIGAESRELLDAFEKNERVVVAFWHGQLGMIQAGYRGRGRGICIEVSRHSDGEIVARATRAYGIRAARGSATRGGIGSAREMLEAHREGYDLAIAADGPRGPRQRAKSGAIRFAQVTGARLFPVACAPRHGHAFASWDRFILPLPFTRVYYTGGAPLSVGRDADERVVEQARERLERDLARLTTEVERRARSD